ncbi:hypothetical protein [Phytomonospora endophytica]|uniref:Uncharacterized protein n=1 Tax=Phytomonospora endophytica TaxID=714109 RepID=A0A841FE72_9ACTN|nr:hypothetical protein [Phytomonospora endophytica]MBB6035571.1 hypothetical protein [Phytomonospora endophytica]GIG70066.1 hypothetical protein Pen01_63610 [Phytomonospora endophytica]
MPPFRALVSLADRLLGRLVPAARADASCPGIDLTFCRTDLACATGAGKQRIRVHGSACQPTVDNVGCC